MKTTSTPSTNTHNSTSDNNCLRDCLFSPNPYSTNQSGFFADMNNTYKTCLSVDGDDVAPLSMVDFSSEIRSSRFTLPNDSFNFGLSFLSSQEDSTSFGSLSTTEEDFEFPLIDKRIEKVSPRQTYPERPIKRRRRVKKPKVLRAFKPSKKVTLRDNIVKLVGKKRVYGDSDIQNLIPVFKQKKNKTKSKNSKNSKISNFSNLFVSAEFCSEKNSRPKGLLDCVQDSMFTDIESTILSGSSRMEPNSLTKVSDILRAMTKSRNLSKGTSEIFSETENLFKGIQELSEKKNRENGF